MIRKLRAMWGKSESIVTGLPKGKKWHFVTYQNADGSEFDDAVRWNGLPDAIMHERVIITDNPANPPWPGEDGDVMTWIESCTKLQITVRTLYVYSHQGDQNAIYREVPCIALMGNRIKVFHWGGWLGWRHCSIYNGQQRVFGY